MREQRETQQKQEHEGKTEKSASPSATPNQPQEPKPSRDATGRIASYKAALTAYRETTAYWPPEFAYSPEHMVKMIENVVDAAFDARDGAA